MPRLNFATKRKLANLLENLPSDGELPTMKELCSFIKKRIGSREVTPANIKTICKELELPNKWKDRPVTPPARMLQEWQHARAFLDHEFPNWREFGSNGND